jgi:hypothetical protein
MTADQAAEAVARLRKEYAAGLPTDPKVQAQNDNRAAVNPILDRLNPANARQRQFLEDSANLQKMKEFGASAEFVQGELAKLRLEYDGWIKAQAEGAEKTKMTTAEMVESFSLMARDIAGSLQGLVSDIKNGNWLSALTGVVDIISQVAGAIGSVKAAGAGAGKGGFNGGIGGGTGGGGGLAGIAGAIGSVASVIGGLFGKKAPGFAQGGSFRVGGRAGVDKNLVQFRATKGERVDITPSRLQGGGAGRRNYFDLRGAVMTEDLLAQMREMADGAAIRGAHGGAMLAQTAGARSARRRLG